MNKKTVLYLHGFASSGQGTKAQYFRRKLRALPQVTFYAFDFNPTPPDFEYMTITGSVNRLRQYLLDRQPDHLSFIGSSMGALVALNYAHRFGGVEKILCLAPALSYPAGRRTEAEYRQWQSEGAIKVTHYAFETEIPLKYDHHMDGLRYLEPVTPAAPMVIIHGQKDDVVSIESSRKYAVDFPGQVELIEVDSDHQLNDRLDLIWEHVQSFLLV